MSFSQTVKHEMMTSLLKEHTSSALLCGIVLSSGSLVLGKRGMTFKISSESQEFIDFVKTLIEREYPSVVIELREEDIGFKQKVKLEMTIDPAVGRQILTDLGIISFSKDSSFVISRVGQKHLVIELNGKIDFLKGMFLGGGSVSIPEHIDVGNISKSQRSNGYHLEYDSQDKEQADLISDILAELDIISGQVRRGENFVVYIKEAESISSLLGVFKAYNSVLLLENERAGREMRNLVNRQANCISANIDKSIIAARIQLDAIEKISQNIGIDALPEPLKEVAIARLNNPEGSLADILEELPTKISKGALSQRFKKIIALSEEV